MEGVYDFRPLLRLLTDEAKEELLAQTSQELLKKPLWQDALRIGTQEPSPTKV